MGRRFRGYRSMEERVRKMVDADEQILRRYQERVDHARRERDDAVTTLAHLLQEYADLGSLSECTVDEAGALVERLQRDGRKNSS